MWGALLSAWLIGAPRFPPQDSKVCPSLACLLKGRAGFRQPLLQDWIGFWSFYGEMLSFLESPLNGPSTICSMSHIFGVDAGVISKNVFILSRS